MDYIYFEMPLYYRFLIKWPLRRIASVLIGTDCADPLMDWEDGTCISDGKGREHMQRKVFEKKDKSDSL
jgi:hypothetical protein